MDPRARRFALREYLDAARTALDRGDRAAALHALNAALAIDPDYLAARALKEQVEWARQWRPEPAAPAPRAQTRPAGPLVSADGWARFESRTRARRAEKRAEATRVLIGQERFHQARAAIEEIREIDPAHPDLIPLSIALDAAARRQATSSRRWGPLLAAIVVFGALLFGARHLEVPERAGPALQPDAAPVRDGTPRQAPSTSRAVSPAGEYAAATRLKLSCRCSTMLELPWNITSLSTSSNRARSRFSTSRSTSASSRARRPRPRSSPASPTVLT